MIRVKTPMTDVEVAKKKGEDQLKIMIARMQQSFSYAETAYHLPISFALTGIAVHDQKAALDVFSRTGSNSLVASECILAEKTAAEGKESSPNTGFIDDTVIRKLGYSLVDGSILGLALVVGTPQSADSAAAICRELQEKYMLTFLAGDVISSLSHAGVKLGLEYRLIPLGSTPAYGIHFVDIIARVAMMFGGVTPGDSHQIGRAHV
jgi:acetyl-CoA decarbonylase/synthase, CODH/ACS complex subunit beta